ncbi:MAG: hypothetical protein Q8N95_11775 [Desulfobacterales bacterium]|nr:hypothetical protein [Desulfobacterales bacterium]
MATAQLKKKVIAAMDDLTEKKVQEVLDFVSYLKLREDEWFIDFVNKRGTSAKAGKKAGKKLTKLEDLQKVYR